MQFLSTQAVELELSNQQLQENAVEPEAQTDAVGKGSVTITVIPTMERTIKATGVLTVQ